MTGIRRTDARASRLALERFQQRRLLAADIGAGADVDLDVEVEPGAAADGGSEAPHQPHSLELGVQPRLQILIFAAQIEEPAGRADRVTGDRHAFENAAGMRSQQHAILERAGFAFVGVANDVTLGARRVAGGFPFEPGGETRAAAPAQVGALHFVEQALAADGDRRVERAAGRHRRLQQRAGAPDIVLDVEKLGRPVVERRARLDQLGDRVDSRFAETRHGEVVDQHRRPLVAHAGARGQIDADEAVGGHLAALDAETAEQTFEQRLIALHPVGDVVGDKQPIGAAGLVIEEGVERHHAFDAVDGNLQPLRNFALGLARKPAQRGLRFAHDLHQVERV